jgi:hypothetical protein
MERFYRATITKQPIGSAVRHKEPAVQGTVIVKVTDSTTAGDYKILVIDCDDAQNKANLTIPGVEELSEEHALKLAAQYQPERTLTQPNPVTMEEEEIDVPTCDLRKFYKK